MSPSGYVWSGVGVGALGVLVLYMASANNGLQDASRAAGADPGSDGMMSAVGVVLLVAGVALLLIGIVGIGVKSGRESD